MVLPSPVVGIVWLINNVNDTVLGGTGVAAGEPAGCVRAFMNNAWLGGVIFVGQRGILMHETYGQNPQIFPLSLREEADRVPETYPRIPDSHEMNWAKAAMGTGQATSPFEYATPLTETMLLGLVALRAGQGRKIHYDGAAMSVTNVPEANQYLHREYRDGWSL